MPVAVATVIALTGCRSQKATEVSTMARDSVTLSVMSHAVLDENISKISQTAVDSCETRIEFTNGKGVIHVSPDGSVTMSNISALSEQGKSDVRTEETLIHSADSATLSIQSVADSKAGSDSRISPQAGKPSLFSLKLWVAVFAMLILAGYFIYNLIRRS